MAKRTVRGQIGQAWSEIAKDEANFITAATKAVENVPSPAEMVDRALVFAAHTLRSQREALVPLLDGLTPKVRKGSKPRPSAASAVSAAYDLAERVVESQRKLLHGLVKSVTPAPVRHAPKRRAAAKATPAHRATRKHVVAHKSAKRAA
ncbi:MAG TPA: hypothetical protein VNF26_08005 [Candidatus Baltobacterales bacterium]|nr:hypothetical protein [Candidatus Baltobacterales bacterium]